MKNENEAQKLYLDLRMLTSHIKEMQERTQLVEEQAMHVMGVIESLDELNEVREGTKAFVPIAEGIFFPATVSETGTLLVNVGADVAVRKSVHDSKMLLASKLDELRGHRDELAAELEKAVGAAKETEKKLVGLLKEEEEDAKGKD